jgi:hypothetical protein
VPHGGLVIAGDVVYAMIGGARAIVQVIFHVAVDGEFLSGVNVLEPAPTERDATTCTDTLRDRGVYKMVELGDLVASAMFLRKGDVVTAVVPPFLR